MNNANYAEYTVSQKAEGKYLRNKILCLALYAVIVVALLSLMVALSNYGVLVAIIVLPFVPLSVMVLRYTTWNRFVQVDHRYEVASAKITFTEIHGKKETVAFEKLVSSFSLIAPVSDEYKDKYEGADVYMDFRGSAKSPNSYFLLLEEDGKKTVVYFEAITKAIKVMSFYNSKNTVTSKTLTI